MTPVAAILSADAYALREGPRVDNPSAKARCDAAIEAARGRAPTARHFLIRSWLAVVHFDTRLDPIDRTCAGAVLDATAAGAPLTKLDSATVEWVSELTKHRGRRWRTHPWTPLHRAALLEAVREIT